MPDSGDPKMFIGHYAPAFLAATNRRSPRLGALFVAAQFVDIAFFLFVLTGVEHMREVPGFTAMNPMDLYDMRFSHSLLGALAFAASWAVATRVLRGSWASAWIGAAVVASHWPIDWLVHAPDLTLAGNGARYGLGLWNHPMIAMPLELALTFGTLAFYAARTRAIGWQGHASLAALVVGLVVLQMIDWLGPKPTVVLDPVPSSGPVTALVAYTLLAALATWVAASRRVKGRPAVTTL